MATRDHYVSQFHLRGFTDPIAAGRRDAWVWVGDCATGEVKRRSPKNFGWSPGLFAGPGSLADPDASVEAFLAKEVEGPAAIALRKFTGEKGPIAGVPTGLGRYLAWAAARSLPMQALFESWIAAMPHLAETEYVEAPPQGLIQTSDRPLVYRMEHPALGIREQVPAEDVERLRNQGWRLRIEGEGFLQLVHLQAWYFQVRFFPRLGWLRLRTPPGASFVIGDRPVVWGFDGRTDEPPALLRHPDVQLVAPLSSSVALFGFQPVTGHPEVIKPAEVNRIVALAAHEWIAGPTEAVVREALTARVYH
jgi:hypothetical protein